MFVANRSSCDVERASQSRNTISISQNPPFLVLSQLCLCTMSARSKRVHQKCDEIVATDASGADAGAASNTESELKNDRFQWPLRSTAACQLVMVDLDTLHTAEQLGPYGCDVHLSSFLAKEIKQFLAELGLRFTFRRGKASLGQLNDVMTNCCMDERGYYYVRDIKWMREDQERVFPELLTDYLREEANRPRCNIIHLDEDGVPFDYEGGMKRSKVFRNVLKGIWEQRHRFAVWNSEQNGYDPPKRYVPYLIPPTDW